MRNICIITKNKIVCLNRNIKKSLKFESFKKSADGFVALQQNGQLLLAEFETNHIKCVFKNDIFCLKEVLRRFNFKFSVNMRHCSILPLVFKAPH